MVYCGRMRARLWILVGGAVVGLAVLGIGARVVRYGATRSLTAEREPSVEERGTLRVGETVVTVEFARTPDAWARGLAHRADLPEGHGMLFEFPSTEERVFWMKDTRIALDIIWMRSGAVVGITAEVLPEPGVPDEALRRYPSPGPVDTVLEVPAGWAAAHGAAVGDPVRVE